MAGRPARPRIANAVERMRPNPDGSAVAKNGRAGELTVRGRRPARREVIGGRTRRTPTHFLHGRVMGPKNWLEKIYLKATIECPPDTPDLSTLKRRLARERIEHEFAAGWIRSGPTNPLLACVCGRQGLHRKLCQNLVRRRWLLHLSHATLANCPTMLLDAGLVPRQKPPPAQVGSPRQKMGTMLQTTAAHNRGCLQQS